MRNVSFPCWRLTAASHMLSHRTKLAAGGECLEMRRWLVGCLRSSGAGLLSDTAGLMTIWKWWSAGGSVARTGCWLLAAGCMSRLWCLLVAQPGVRRRECWSRHVATRRWSSSLFWSYFLLLVQHVDKMFHQSSLLAHRRSNYCCISSCFHRAFKVLNFTVKMNCRNLGKLQYKVSSSEYIFILDCYISSQSFFGIFFIRWIYSRWLGSLNWT